MSACCGEPDCRRTQPVLLQLQPFSQRWAVVTRWHEMGGGPMEGLKYVDQRHRLLQETSDMLTAAVAAVAVLDDMEPEDLAEAFHDHYERLAPDHGYSTRPESRGAFADAPNRELMVATAAAVLEQIRRTWSATALREGYSSGDAGNGTKRKRADT